MYITTLANKPMSNITYTVWSINYFWLQTIGPNVSCDWIILSPLELSGLIFTEWCLRTFARKFSNILHWFFSENFTIERWWVSDVRNVKNWGITDFFSQRTCPENHPNLSKSGSKWPKTKVALIKSQNIAIRALKGSLLCQICFEWTYQAKHPTLIFCSFLGKVEIIVNKSVSEKKSRGHRTSKIIKSNQSSRNGYLPSHCSFQNLACALDEWRGMWICVRSKDAQKQLAWTSLRQIS